MVLRLTKKILLKIFACALSVALALTGVSVLVGTRSAYASAFDDAQESAKFMSAYETQSEAEEALAELGTQVVEEGVTLLKNESNALPLTARERKISLFGVTSVDFAYSGGGSGGSVKNPVKLIDALREAGFKVNPVLEAMYQRAFNDGYDPNTAGSVDTDWSHEAPMSYYTKAVRESYAAYNDVAIIMFSRTGTERQDPPIHGMFGEEGKEQHYHSCELLPDEKAMVEEALSGNFKKVLVFVNTGMAFECAELQDNPNIDAILWTSLIGSTGATAIPKILTGEVTPSGRTVDIWAADMEKEPVWQNVGGYQDGNYHKLLSSGTVAEAYPANRFKNSNGKFFDQNGKEIDSVTDEKGSYIPGMYYEVEYEEGIFVGYRYYETAAADGFLTNTSMQIYDRTTGEKIPYYTEEIGMIPEKYGSDAYYNRDTGVVYPFGYGLSYTNFDWEIVSSTPSDTAVTANTELDIKVKVTNKGYAAGKDVVQLYVHAPWTKDSVDKAEVVLVDFAKTDELRPGQSQVVELSVKASDFASYDYDASSLRTTPGYILEKGDYELRLQMNSHEMKSGDSKVIYTVEEDIEINTDSATGNEIHNNFSDPESELYTINDLENSDMQIMRRGYFETTFPTMVQSDELVLTDDELAHFNYTLGWASEKDAEVAAGTETVAGSEYWLKTNEDIPANWTQADNADTWQGEEVTIHGRTFTTGRTAGKANVQFSDMIGVEDDAIWDAFMNQLTYDELTSLVVNGGYTTAAIPSIGKNATKDEDGPHNVGGNADATPVTALFGATWNVDLTYRYGQLAGNINLFTGRTGWYAPGVNIHRSPFGGRNFEYYSQDGVHSGKMASALIRGAAEYGLYTYVKHYALNDQENHRGEGYGGLFTYASEQSMREIYLKSFEICVKEGGTKAVMSSFNRIGDVNSTANYVLNNSILRDEWGFNGFVVTDYYDPGYNDVGLMNRNGCDAPLNGGSTKYNSQTGAGVNTAAGVGVWDSSKRDGKGNVMVASGENTVESATQYYATRKSAEHILRGTIGSSVHKNMYDVSLIEKGKLVATANGMPYSGSVAIPNANEVGVEKISYSIAGLPEGFTYSPDGTITGMSEGAVAGLAEAEESYTLQVTPYLDGWVAGETMEYVLEFRPTFQFTALSGQIGNEFTSEISSTYYVPNPNYLFGEGVGGPIKYSSKNLPAGLSIANDNTITGTPTEAGVFDVTVTVSYGVPTWYGSYGPFPGTEKRDFNVTLKIADENGVVPGDTGSQQPGGEVTLESIQAELDALKAQVESGDLAGMNEAISALQDKVTALENGGGIDLTSINSAIAELQEKVKALEESGGGCGSVVGMSSAFGALALAALSAAAVLFIRKKRTDTGAENK